MHVYHSTLLQTCQAKPFCQTPVDFWSRLRRNKSGCKQLPLREQHWRECDQVHTVGRIEGTSHAYKIYVAISTCDCQASGAHPQGLLLYSATTHVRPYLQKSTENVWLGGDITDRMQSSMLLRTQQFKTSRSLSTDSQLVSTSTLRKIGSIT